ncbi:MAG TPA: hypothetical protein DCS01_05975 [Idiomarina abyssalis]|uniref:methyl-accepting chemotaxis protein n=1 Tax=Idiomarina TaxID=135575 RepID=UPI000C481C03|nr:MULTISPECIES: methyl-accepting chemotaxis protein [Idiomarina]MBH93406.1 hypothetical protein [Idiomarina sp.]HAS14830.1 hypothetical protein [Idiomarina abyssalis]
MKLSNMSLARINQINLLFLVSLAVILGLALFSDITDGVLAVPGLVITLLAVVFFIISRRFLTLAVKELKSMAEQVSNGNLDPRVNLSSDSEFGQIARSLNRALKRFSRILTHVDGATEKLSNLAERTASVSDRSHVTSEKLSEQSTSLASTIEEISASMNEMTATIERINSNTDSVSEVSITSEQQISKLAERLNKLVSSVELFDSSFDKVEKSAEKITSFVELIESVTEQTNLLALNAAIEAARAGQHGRGFAVVADEVRSLAQKTKATTSDIVNMTNELRAVISSSGEISDQALEASKEAQIISTETIESFNLVLASIREINAEVDMVTEASKQQNDAVENVSKSIQVLSELCDGAYEQAETLSSNTDELNNLSNEIVKQMDKLDD